MSNAVFLNSFRVLGPLASQYTSLVGQADIKTVFSGAKLLGTVIKLLEGLVGVVQGCQVSTVHQVFTCLSPCLSSLVPLLSLYHNYNKVVELILEMFTETAKRILCYYTAAESRVLYDSSLAIIRTYADHQVSGNWQEIM